MVLIRTTTKGRDTYHIDDDGKPKCGTHIRSGDWVSKEKDALPIDYGICKRCSGEVDRSSRDNSLLERAKNGEPEDFVDPYQAGEDWYHE